MDDDSCVHCGDIETLEHMFFLCPAVKLFWEEFTNFWQLLSGELLFLNDYRVIFGIYPVKKCVALNHAMLIAK